MSKEIREAVRRGAALLDEREPGWRDRFSPAELEMEDCNNCVLGQVFGNYTTGLAIFGISHGLPENEPRQYGFHVPFDAYTESWDFEKFPALRDTWIGYLKGHWE